MGNCSKKDHQALIPAKTLKYFENKISAEDLFKKIFINFSLKLK